ncbi:MAG: acyl-CoA dehydrogenase family protein, partial [Bacteroidia bacterium]
EATAVKKNGAYILSGQKLFVTNAPIAGAFIVYALTDRKKGFFGGVSAFVVDTTIKGVMVSPVKDKMGLRTAQMADVTFTNVKLTESDLLGREGAGAGIFNKSMQWERIVVSAMLCGQLERVLSESITFLKKRKAGHNRLFELQAVQHTLAEIKTAHAAGAQLVYAAASAIDAGDKQSMALSSMAKLFVSEQVVESIRKLQALHGGYGYLTSAGLEREYRDAFAALLYSGTSSIQKNIIAGTL